MSKLGGGYTEFQPNDQKLHSLASDAAHEIAAEEFRDLLWRENLSDEDILEKVHSVRRTYVNLGRLWDAIDRTTPEDGYAKTGAREALERTDPSGASDRLEVPPGTPASKILAMQEAKASTDLDKDPRGSTRSHEHPDG